MRFFVDASTLILYLAPPFAALAAMALIRESWLASFKEAIKTRNHLFTQALLFFVFLTLAILIVINRSVFHSFMNSADEHSCLFFAQCLLQGKFWVAHHPFKEFFLTPHVGALDDKWFSVYPPGWPIIWAAAIKLHLKDLINPIIASVSLIPLALLGNRIYGKKVTLIAILFLIVSPFFLFTSAAYYSHNACLLLLLCFAYTFFKWRESGRISYAWAAGLLLGYCAATRYLTTASMALPFLALFLTKKGRGQIDLKGSFAFFLTSGILTLAHFYYNYRLTGSFFDFPNHYLQSHEKLGFIAGYTPLTALKYFIQRMTYLMDWTPPFFLFIGVVGLFFMPRSVEDRVLQWSVMLLPMGYMFYYSWGGNQYGPRYLYEAYPLFCLVVASTAIKIWDLYSVKTKKALVGFLIASWIATFPILQKHMIHYEKVSWQRQDIYRTAEAETKKPSLVFLKGFFGDELVMSQHDSVRNHPLLNTPVIYAHDKAKDNKNLIRVFPDRTPYHATYDRSKKKTVLKKYAPFFKK